MKLVWTRLAATDRKDIRDYIAQDQPSAALALDMLISEKSDKLKKYPSMGRLGRVSGTRELVIHPNYILIYDVTIDSIRILRILHAARRWPP